MAFTTTASCAALIVAGFLGYALIGEGQFSGGRSWSDATIWWQIWLGLALLLFAALSWRRASLPTKRRR